MHSSKFTRLAQVADERSAVIVAVVEDIAANAESQHIVGAVILETEVVVEEVGKRPRWSFARFIIAGDEVAFEGEQHTYGNLSKAFKFLSDYTLDRRPMVFLESGQEVESKDGEKSAA